MNSQTSPTLFERMRDGSDPLVWDEFFNHYWRLIFTCAKHRGCSDHTAEEIVQDVMLAVFQKRVVFRYDPARGRFRDWLGAVVRNLVIKRRERASERIRARGGDSAQAFVEPEAGDAQPDAAWEAAFQQEMLLILLDVVRREVSPPTYQAFELLELRRQRGKEVARITGLSRNAVYLARRRVFNRLRELGAPYREDGQLGHHLRQALNHRPAANVERLVTERIESTMRTGWECKQ